MERIRNDGHGEAVFYFDYIKVIAADLSPKMLALVRQKHGARFGAKLLLLHTDIHHCVLADQSVAVVICNGVYPHFHNKQLALSEINRILKPGGVLAINHFGGKEFINAVHAGAPNERIRGDLLYEVSHLADQVETAGFTVKRVVDTESEYCLVAVKP
jgi:ubiquinone/menaquinone biosynthesis C-methylase UbiE